jgi:hypothetical protein
MLVLFSINDKLRDIKGLLEMIVKKAGKQVIGAHLTNAEQKALDIEIRKVYAEYDRKNANELDAIFLMYLHLKYGWGHDRLKQAYFGIAPEIEKLAERYEMTGEGDRVFLATHMLKKMGCDIEEWAKEVEKNAT